MIPRRKRFHYAIVNLANVQHINPYFAKMGDDGWDLVSVSDGKAFFKRPKSTTLDQDISDYTSHLKKELAKYETELEKMNDSHLYDLDTLKILFGPFSVGEWQYALEKINIQDRAYLLRLGLSDEDITKKPRIKISTIHAAKGGECDNVLLTTDMNIKTYSAYQKDSDDEKRVFYVGATRAKEELHVLLPQTTMHFRLAL